MKNQSIDIDGQPGHRLQNQDSTGLSTIKMGLDVHQASVVVVAQWDHARPKPPQRFNADDLVAWMGRLKARGHRLVSVYEASGFGFVLHRRLEALGVESYVTTAQILDTSFRGVKTDGRDAHELCLRLDRFIFREEQLSGPEKQPRHAQKKSILGNFDAASWFNAHASSEISRLFSRIPRPRVVSLHLGPNQCACDKLRPGPACRTGRNCRT